MEQTRRQCLANAMTAVAVLGDEDAIKLLLDKCQKEMVKCHVCSSVVQKLPIELLLRMRECGFSFDLTSFPQDYIADKERFLFLCHQVRQPTEPRESPQIYSPWVDICRNTFAHSGGGVFTQAQFDWFSEAGFLANEVYQEELYDILQHSWVEVPIYVLNFFWEHGWRVLSRYDMLLKRVKTPILRTWLKEKAAEERRLQKENAGTTAKRMKKV